MVGFLNISQLDNNKKYTYVDTTHDSARARMTYTVVRRANTQSFDCNS